ncbi:MAG: restriction endonuclease subunit S, partial [Pseudomonadota bacterium]|nr:restriction endonuclease subunit S [Pseudomonadota bacterium]
MAEHFAFSKVRAATRADWPVVPLGAVITRSEYGTSDPASAEGTIPIIGMKEVVDGNVLLDPSARIEGDAETLAPLMVRRGDILLNRTNSPDLVGKTGICRGDADAVFASYLVRLHVDAKKADAEYVNYWLNDAETQKLIKRVSTRAVSQANVNPTELKRHCPIPLPPLPEQRRIAGILRTWDEAIGAASRLIDAKRRRLDAITFRLVFGGARLANFGDADARQDARWFNLPAAWRVVKIGDVAKEISRTNADGAVSEVLSCSKHDGFVRSLEYFKKQVFSSDLSGYRVIS